MSGVILETWIITEILKGTRHNGRRVLLCFYRERDGKEIDLLIVQDGTVCPLEFRKTASPGRDDVGHFRVLGKTKVPAGPGGAICLAQKALPLATAAQSIPVAAL